MGFYQHEAARRIGAGRHIVAPEFETWQFGKRSISVSSLTKAFWPEDGYTKEDMLRYYRTVAPAMLPYLVDRPVTLRAFPDGIHGFFY